MVEAGWQFRRTIPSIAPRGAARLAQRSEALALQPRIFVQFAKRKAPACHPQRPCAGTGKTGRAERFICDPSALTGRGRRAAECLVRDRLAESVAGIQTKDRKHVVAGKRVAVRVDIGGRVSMKKKKH